MVVMVQREVAGEMAAQPGEMGLLSVCVQLYANVEKLFDVPPAAFRPTPKVTSSVVRLSVLPRPRLTLDSAESFFRLVRAGFRAPRKQMRNSFAIGLGVASEDAGRLLAAAGIDPSRRAATLSLSEWSAVYRVWREGRSPDQNLSL
jgi:16S rRNA (adenine1518-N6/adenine1519-N6)-dimethyltransferase